MKRKAVRTADGIDWLAVAIARIGLGHAEALEHAARRLKVPCKVIVGWLNDGLGDAPFGMVVKLSELGDVPLGCLSRRRGPWKFTKQEQEWFSGKKPYPPGGQFKSLEAVAQSLVQKRAA